MSNKSKIPSSVWFAILAVTIFPLIMNLYFDYMQNKREVWKIEASKTPAEYAINLATYIKSKENLPKSVGEYPGEWTDVRAQDNRLQMFWINGDLKTYNEDILKWPTSEEYKQYLIKNGYACDDWKNIDPKKGIILEFFMSYKGTDKGYHYFISPKDCGR